MSMGKIKFVPYVPIATVMRIGLAPPPPNDQGGGETIQLHATVFQNTMCHSTMLVSMPYHAIQQTKVHPKEIELIQRACLQMPLKCKNRENTTDET